jgi:hypothetical protein
LYEEKQDSPFLVGSEYNSIELRNMVTKITKHMKCFMYKTPLIMKVYSYSNLNAKLHKTLRKLRKKASSELTEDAL